MFEIFDEIKIENTNRIDKEDKNFCETFNKIYNETLECYKNTLNSLIVLYNQQILIVKNSYDLDVSMYGDKLSISNVIDSILYLKPDFISKICHYFNRKYNITIDYEKICDKYKDSEIPYEKRTNKDKTINPDILQYTYLDYNIILDGIFEQLGGFSFLERAVDEIKQQAKTPLHYYSYRKYWNYELKGKTIKFRVNIRDIKPALYYYDSNETEIIDYFTHNKVDDHKSYENGNTDIKFYNAQYALEFATKYLGYVEMTAEEREIYKSKC